MGVRWSIEFVNGSRKIRGVARLRDVSMPLVSWSLWRRVRLTGATMNVAGAGEYFSARARILCRGAVIYSGLVVLCPIAGADAFLPQSFAPLLEVGALPGEDLRPLPREPEFARLESGGHG